jgi:hypothetical protein
MLSFFIFCFGFVLANVLTLFSQNDDNVMFFDQEERHNDHSDDVTVTSNLELAQEAYDRRQLHAAADDHLEAAVQNARKLREAEAAAEEAARIAKLEHIGTLQGDALTSQEVRLGSH